MATLNGAEFKIIEVEWSTYQNNVIQEILGSDTVEVQNQGHGSEPVRIRGMVNNEKEMDDFQEQFYSNGVLTLIKDSDSGRQYQVYALGNVRRENIINSLSYQGIIFTCIMQLKYPYSESVSTVTRSKSISTQNQEWSVDDDSMDIKTEGNVDTTPDIQVTGGEAGTELSSNPVGEPSFETVTGWTYAELDTNTKISGAQGDIPYAGTYTYKIEILTGSQVGDYGQISRTVDFTDIDQLSAMIRVSGGLYRGDFKILVDGDELGSWGDMTGSAYFKKSVDTSSYTGSLTLTLKYVVSGTDASIYVRLDNIRAYKHRSSDIQIYNTSDATVKCLLANEILNTAIHRINPDGTGSVIYADDFTTDKYLAANEGILGVSLDAVNDELDIADNGYIYWKIDTKLPIDGIPIITSRIDITTLDDSPTLQISINGSTWYDIDTSIVDDVETEYPLESDGNLSLASKTAFYFRLDCVKGSPTACSVKYFQLDVNMHTIYSKNPKITIGSSANTFRIDQDTEGDVDCVVDLVFKNRWWV